MTTYDITPNELFRLVTAYTAIRKPTIRAEFLETVEAWRKVSGWMGRLSENLSIRATDREYLQMKATHTAHSSRSSCIKHAAVAARQTSRSRQLRNEGYRELTQFGTVLLLAAARRSTRPMAAMRKRWILQSLTGCQLRAETYWPQP